MRGVVFTLNFFAMYVTTYVNLKKLLNTLKEINEWIANEMDRFIIKLI